MKKFILIDHSIKDSGGHHLEYALRVLKAAKSAGYRTVLAVNKSCIDFEHESIDVIDKAFSHGFWENFSCERQKPIKSKKNFFKTLIEKREDLIYEILFSQLGFAYQLLSEGRTASSLVKKYHLVSDDQKIPLWAIVFGAILLKFRYFYQNIANFSTTVLNKSSKPLRLLMRPMKFIGGLVLAPVILSILIIRWKNIVGGFDKFSALFANECRHLLARNDISEGDLIFVPTLGNVELTGISFCSQAKVLSGVKWHLLFRRNLFLGREQKYLDFSKSVHLMNPLELRNSEEIEKTHIVFSEFKRKFANGDVKFYTDTNPLTEQWNLLGLYHFSTLPIPHDQSLKKIQHVVTEPLIICYVGDAREEKGYQHLYRLVCDIRAAGFDKRKIIFRFQSNFNVPLGEAATRIAKAELSLMSTDGVELMEGPFASDQYTSLINDSDILLVPYDEDNYYARSSGVFAEALMAGVPVVFPARSWMGRELVQDNIRYSQILEKSSQPSPWKPLLEMDVKTTQISVSQSLPNAVMFFKYLLRGVHPGHYIKISCFEVVKVKSLKNKREENLNFVGSTLIDLRAERGTCFIQLINAGNYTVKFEHCNGSNQNEINQIPDSYFSSIEYRISGASKIYARQSVGYGYESVDEFSKGVLDIVSRYTDYEERARTFSENWRQFHLASTLVTMLTDEEQAK